MIITIKDSSLCASIDTMGAQLISLKDNQEKEYIWQRDPQIWMRCSPLLFPVVGNCRNDKTIINGKWYTMPRHGFCKDMEFSVIKQSESSVSLFLSYTRDTLEHYPYKFGITLTYTVSESALSIIYRPENFQEDPMPFFLGAHPGFRCPLNDGERFDDYQLLFDQEESTSSMVYDLTSLEFDPEKAGITLKNTHVLSLSYNIFQNDAVFFEKIHSRKVSLIHKISGKGIQVDFPNFQSIAFWTCVHPEAPFLCIEPWNGSGIRKDEDDEFIHKHGIQILDGNQSSEYFLQIRILK